MDGRCWCCLPHTRNLLVYRTYKCIYLVRRMAELFWENNDTAGNAIGKLRETVPSAARLNRGTGELPESFIVPGRCLLNNFRRELRGSAVAIPVRRQQPVSHELLVV